MNITLDWLESQVATNWSSAVAEAARLFPHSRETLYAALGSADPELRSAAVAALNEAGAADAHDKIVPLLQDSSGLVRDEALEFLTEFPREEDVPALLEALLKPETCFMSTLALARLTGQLGPVLTDESDPADLELGATEWRFVVNSWRSAPSGDA